MNRDQAALVRPARVKSKVSGFVILALSLMCGVIAHAQAPAPRFPTDHISVEEWRTYQSEVETEPGVTCSVDDMKHEYLCVSDELLTIWIFTREGHPAHPSVARGVIWVRNDRLVQATYYGGYYAGSEEAWRNWYDPALRGQPQWAEWAKRMTPHSTQ
jgi:hypothetical protein